MRGKGGLISLSLAIYTRQYQLRASSVGILLHRQPSWYIRPWAASAMDSLSALHSIRNVLRKCKSPVFLSNKENVWGPFGLGMLNNTHDEHSVYPSGFSNSLSLGLLQQGAECIGRLSMFLSSTWCFTPLVRAKCLSFMPADCVSVFINLLLYAEYSSGSVRSLRQLGFDISSDSFTSLRRSPWSSRCSRGP